MHSSLLHLLFIDLFFCSWKWLGQKGCGNPSSNNQTRTQMQLQMNISVTFQQYHHWASKIEWNCPTVRRCDISGPSVDYLRKKVHMFQNEMFFLSYILTLETNKHCEAEGNTDFIFLSRALTWRTLRQPIPTEIDTYQTNEWNKCSSAQQTPPPAEVLADLIVFRRTNVSKHWIIELTHGSCCPKP